MLALKHTWSNAKEYTTLIFDSLNTDMMFQELLQNYSVVNRSQLTVLIYSFGSVLHGFIQLFSFKIMSRPTRASGAT